jgi:hypothetical protein
MITPPIVAGIVLYSLLCFFLLLYFIEIKLYVSQEEYEKLWKIGLAGHLFVVMLIVLLAYLTRH